MDIGERIRARRKELNLSLRRLADQVDLTASFLSRIERGQGSPSIESLRKISNALEVPIFYFLAETNNKSPVVRHNQRTKFAWPDSHLLYELLVPSLNRKMEAFLGEHKPAEENIAVSLSQYTEEFIFVLQGHLDVELTTETYRLEPGDSIYFEGPMLLRLTAVGNEILRFISVITPPAF